MISVVIPLFNEEKNLRSLYKELMQIIPRLSKKYEILFVDDGSSDSSLNILKFFSKKNKNVRIFSFRKNQGKAEALSLGFMKAKGDYIAMLDADLQDKPSEIPKLLEKVREGHSVVCGWRKKRMDSFGKVLSSKCFNSLASLLWGLNLHDYNCGMKIMSKDVAKALRLYGGMHRFIPLLAYQEGFKVSEVVVAHGKRRFGTSKYGFSKLWKDLPDIFTVLFLTRYAKRPLHFFGMAGGVFLVAGFMILSYLSILRFQGESIGRRPLLLFGILLVISGFQIFLTGFLADLIINISHRSDDFSEHDTSLKYATE